MRAGTGNNKRGPAALFLALCVAISIMAASSGPAKAQGVCGGGCDCTLSTHAELAVRVTAVHQLIAIRIRTEFDLTRDWMEETIFHEFILPAFRDIATEITASAMFQEFAFGMFIDASQQLKVQRTFQELSARAHKDYHPSLQICRFGTTVHSLGMSDFVRERTTMTFNEWQMKRQRGNSDVAGTAGEISDRPSRLETFKRRYCEFSDNNNGLERFCADEVYDAGERRTQNLDIDYAAVMGEGGTTVEGGGIALTMEGGVMGPSMTGTYDFARNDAMQLGSNLYGHTPAPRINESTFFTQSGDPNIANQKKVLDVRSLIAKRSVAIASFNHNVGIRSEGSTDAYTYSLMNTVFPILREFGFGSADIIAMYSRTPSYYAQMELLTKKMYQSPRFYTELYDKPANTERKKVILQGIGLMQDFDTLESYLRTEMMLSMILELELIKMQGIIQGQIDSLRTGGERG